MSHNFGRFLLASFLACSVVHRLPSPYLYFLWNRIIIQTFPSLFFPHVLFHELLLFLVDLAIYRPYVIPPTIQNPYPVSKAHSVSKLPNYRVVYPPKRASRSKASSSATTSTTTTTTTTHNAVGGEGGSGGIGGNVAGGGAGGGGVGGGYRGGVRSEMQCQHEGGTCEFFLLCWMSGGLLQGSCGGLLKGCCHRTAKSANIGIDTGNTVDLTNLPNYDYGPIQNDPSEWTTAIGKIRGVGQFRRFLF